MGKQATEVNDKIMVGLADGHALFRLGIKTVLGTQSKYEILFEADNVEKPLKLTP
jgi:DNA-binding NarL/FixJ family response regulator